MADSLKRRLSRIEQGADVAAAVAELAAASPVDASAAWAKLAAVIETAAGVQVGTLSRTSEDARAKGFDGMAAEMASVLGMTTGELAAALRARASGNDRSTKDGGS